MFGTLRIGTHIWPGDPFWVQVGEAIEQSALKCNVELVSIAIENTSLHSEDEQIRFAEEVLAQNLDTLVSGDLSERSLNRILVAGLPIIYLSEIDFRHPQLVSPLGLHNVAVMVGEYLVEHLKRRGRVLVVGGLRGTGDVGRSRLAGIRAAVQAHPEIHIDHIPCAWGYEEAYPEIVAGMSKLGAAVDAIFGLSDSLALAARDAGCELGTIDKQTLIVGINGDPLALAAIAGGKMTATIRTSAVDLGNKVLELAVQAARCLPLPTHFSYQPQLVTRENVAEIAAQQLIALAALPNHLVGFNRRQEQQRLVQLETSLEINRRAGLIVDRQRLSHALSDLIRANYGYDTVQLFLWEAHNRRLVLEQAHQATSSDAVLQWDASPVLQAVLARNEPIFIPDTRHSHHFAPDPMCLEARSRVVVPIRLGGQISGLLDLHSYHSTHHTHHELVGLQTLADQLGIALRNAELYSEAVQARLLAEKADQLKTRLLANVSHELRTPLNIILGYSQTALMTPSAYDVELPPVLRNDLEHIHRSGQHLIRLINDLLDLSRAEIDELDLFPETVASRAFLEEVFHSIADQARTERQVAWRLAVPLRLPSIQADPLRLRQILLNLLHNARKFTSSGEIQLGAEVVVPHLHIWVADTGKGIPIEEQERIFEPFMTAQQDERHAGIGLGLSITRRLVALHSGSMTLESQQGQGSTFHLYLPLPHLNNQPLMPNQHGLSDPAAQGIGMTSVVLKPLGDTKLLDALDRLRSPADAGPILIVDDDPQAHELYRRQIALRLPDYPLQSAHGGRAALALLEQETPSLMILDLLMPEVDGFAVLTHLRATSRTRHVPVLVISGHMLSFEDVHRLDQGHVVFHSKDVLTDAEAAETVRRSLLQANALPAQTSTLVLHAVAYIHQNHAYGLSRQKIADAVGVNKDYLTRIFHRELGISPWDYLNRYRVIRAKELLCSTHVSIAAVAMQVGFADAAYFSRVFHNEVGCSPRDYREHL